MMTTTIRLDNELKLKAKELADNLGLSFNQLVTLKLKEFIINGDINVNAFDSSMVEVNEDAEVVLDYFKKSIA